jgi:hypothetical protein
MSVPAVNGSVCDACCRHALPENARLNPVIASLVFAAAEQAIQQSLLEPSEYVFLYQARQFAARWLNARSNHEPCRAAPIESGTWQLPIPAPADSAGSWSAGKHRAVPLTIGLVGQHSPSGLGHMHKDIAMHLGIDRWLIPSFQDRSELPRGLPCRVDLLDHPSDTQLLSWLRGLDVVLFIERPAIAGLTNLARQQGVTVVCVPMWEYLHPGQEWLDDVDLMLAPTQFTAALLWQWKWRFRFPWKLKTLPWPVDTDRFRFRQRSVCRRFVFVNGVGGRPALARDGFTALYQRKGLEVLFDAARLAPEIPIIVYSGVRSVDVPASVELRPPPVDNSLLYCDADVCVQPSHWEGLGLQLLECQAAGMPLITTDAPPMNEHCPWALIPAKVEPAFLRPQQCIVGARIDPHHLAASLRAVHGRRIGRASRSARRFIEREHSWRVALPKFLLALADVVPTAKR